MNNRRIRGKHAVPFDVVVFIGLVLAANALLFTGISFADSIDIIIEPGNNHQDIQGWGAGSCFNEGKFTGLEDLPEEIYPKIFNDLGTNMIRIRIYSDFQPSPTSGYNWDCMSDQRRILDQALAPVGTIDTIHVCIFSPPQWMMVKTITGWRLKQVYYQDYADYITAYVSGMDNLGYQIKAVSLFNEPGADTHYESTDTTPEQFCELLPLVRNTLNQAGYRKDDVKLCAPDTYDIDDDYKGCIGRGFIQAIGGDLICLDALSIWTTHQYNEGLRVPPQNWQDWEGLRDTIYNLPLKRDLWHTEVANLKDPYAGIKNALEVSWWIWRALCLGNASAWHFFHYYGFSTPDDIFAGLVMIDEENHAYTLTSSYYGFMHWCKNIPPGSTRVNVIGLSSGPDLHVAAFKYDQSNLTVVAFNIGTQDITVNFDCGSPIQGNVYHIRSEGDDYYITQPLIVPSASEFNAAILDRSISTFKLHL